MTALTVDARKIPASDEADVYRDCGMSAAMA
jgi:hypothetical protein